MALASAILETEFYKRRNTSIAKTELDLGDYALSQKGASASATHSDPGGNHPASAAINGDRTHINWGATADPRGGWMSDDIQTQGAVNLEIDFGQTRIINRIEIFSYPKNALNDPIANPGLKDFTIEWNSQPSGGTWNPWTTLVDGGGGDGDTTIASGVVSGNTRTWNIFKTDTEISCRRIRLVITDTQDTNYARVCQFEAYRTIVLTKDEVITIYDTESGEVNEMTQDRLIEGRVTRRKDFNFNKFVAGQATLTLANEDRKLSPRYIPSDDEKNNKGYFNEEIKPELRMRISEGFDQIGLEEVVQTGIYYVKTWDIASDTKRVSVTMRDRTSRLLRKIFDGPTTILENYEIEKLIEWVALRRNISVDEMDLATTNTQVPTFFPKDKQAWQLIQELAESLGFAAVFFDERGLLKYEFYLETLPHEYLIDTKTQWDSGTVKPPNSLETPTSPTDIHLKLSDFFLDDFEDGDYTSNPTWTSISGSWSIIQGSTSPSHLNTSKFLAVGSHADAKISLPHTKGSDGIWAWDAFTFGGVSPSQEDQAHFYFADGTNPATLNGYRLRLEFWTTPPLWRWFLERIDAGVATQLGTTTAFNNDQNQIKWHIELQRDASGNFTVSIEQTQSGFISTITATDANHNTWSSFLLRLTDTGVFPTADLQFDNFFFYPYPVYTQDQNWDGPATGTEQLRGMTEVDYMEYANDTLIQAAWVSSAAPDTLDTLDGASINAYWTEATNGNGTLVQSGGKIAFSFTGVGANADAATIYSTNPETDAYKVKVTFKALGTVASEASDVFPVYIMHEDQVGVSAADPEKFKVWIFQRKSDGAFVVVHRDPGEGWNVRYWDFVNEVWSNSAKTLAATWGNTYKVEVERTGNQTADNYIIKLYDDADNQIGTTAITPLSGVDNGTSNDRVYIADWRTDFHYSKMDVFEIEYLYEVSGGLQVYSESTILQQGSYSLKIVADATESLNEEIVRTLSPAQDWSGKDKISFWIRSSRTGTNIRYQFGESASNENTFNITINSADTWERKILDISSIADADKDAVTKMAFYILNADSDTTYYIDAVGFYEYTALAQQFTPSGDNAIGRIDLFLTKTGSPTGNIWAEMQTDDGTGKPSGIIRKTSKLVSTSTIPAGPGWIQIEYETIPLGMNGQKYHIVLKADYAYSTTDYIEWSFDDSPPTYTGGDGSAFDEGESAWTSFTDKDFLFREFYVSAGFPITDEYDGWWIGPNIDTGNASPIWDKFEFDDVPRNLGLKDRVHIKLFTQVAPDASGSPGTWDDYVEIAGWDGTEFTYTGSQMIQSLSKQWIRPIVYFRGIKESPPLSRTPFLHWLRLNWWTGGGNTVPEKAFDLFEDGGTLIDTKMRFSSEEGGRGKIISRALIKAKRRYKQDYETVWNEAAFTLQNGDDVTLTVDLEEPCDPDTTGADQMKLWVNGAWRDADGDGDDTSITDLTITFTRHPTKPTLRFEATGTVNITSLYIDAKPYKVVAPIEVRASASDLDQIEYEGEDLVFENEFLATRAIAEKIAQDAIENMSEAQTYLVNTVIRYCPTLQIGDIVWVKDHYLGINDYYQVFGYNRSFGKHTMTITARKTSFRGLESPGT